MAPQHSVVAVVMVPTFRGVREAAANGRVLAELRVHVFGVHAEDLAVVPLLERPEILWEILLEGCSGGHMDRVMNRVCAPAHVRALVAVVPGAVWLAVAWLGGRGADAGAQRQQSVVEDRRVTEDRHAIHSASASVPLCCLRVESSVQLGRPATQHVERCQLTQCTESRTGRQMQGA